MDVSVIITAYNYAAYVRDCIASCLQQQPSALTHEVIVVDDGSTDQTPSLLQGLDDPRLRCFRIDNSGIERAANFGIAQARGRHIVRVDADDLLGPDYLRGMQAHLGAGAGFVYPDYTVIDGQGRVTAQVALPPFEPDEIRGRGDFLAGGTLYDAEVLRSVGCYSTHVRNSGLENYALILTLLAAGVQGRHVAQPLFAYRRHALNMSDVKRDQIIRNGRQLFAEMGLGEYRTNQYHPYQLKLP